MKHNKSTIGGVVLRSESTFVPCAGCLGDSEPELVIGRVTIR